MSNQNAFIRFKELIASAQQGHDEARDIRSFILSLVDKRIGIGMVGEGLKTRFGANLGRVFPRYVPLDSPDFETCDTFFATGTIFSDPEHTHKGGVRLFNRAPAGANIIFFEPAFLATTHSWAHSFQQSNPAYACLGYVYDDMAYYFMADYPNRIIQKLNSDETPSDAEMTRAHATLERIVHQRVSKYNAQPMHAPAMTEGYARRVLVCDQAYADASTVYGKVGDAEFERMLLAAITENPDAEILVKTHPDTVWEKETRTGYYAHLKSQGRVRLLRDPVNPYVLFDLVDTVYVGTSQMGLEALFAGKKVVTFGAPFYAGWGLTDDRQKIPHRHRNRTLAEIFHYFYVWYSIYHLPDQDGPAEIEDVLSYIERNRPYPLPPTQAELAAPPKVSVVIPVYGVETYIEECIASVQRQTLREIEIIPINDASPDGSQAIIDRLAAEDPRIRPIVLDTNVKQGMARNRGLEQARGDYVWLLDGDDWLPENDMFRQLVARAEANTLDMVRAPKAFEAVFDETDTLLFNRPDKTEDHFQEPVARTDFAGSPHLLHNRHCWTWLYRRGFLDDNDIRFVTPQWEERAFLLKALVRARSIGISTVTGPAYRVRVGSTARRQRGPTDFEMMLINFGSTFDYLLEQGAADRDHPLRLHLNYQVSQFIQHMFITGPYAHYRALGGRDEADFIDRLRGEFARCDFRPGDFVSDMPKLSKKHLHASAYPLAIAAILAKRPDLLRIAVDVAPVPQARLYEALRTDPSDRETADLQAALNRYARNERVTTALAPRDAGAPSRPRIVIHIGATKTGSTFIQNMLERNRPALLRQGVWFPEVGLFWQPTRPHKQAGHAPFTRAAVKDDPALLTHIRRGLELMDGSIHTVVLSSEAFFLHESAYRLAEYFADYPVEMVVYLRRQDEWANSQYCEFVAGGAVGRVDVPIETWLEEPSVKQRLDYAHLLEKWSGAIGQGNVRARVFDRASFVDGDLMADFADAAGLPQLRDLPRPDTREHNDARLSATHVELLRQFNTRPFASRDSYFDFIEEVGTAIGTWRHDNGLPQPKPWLLSVERADALMEAYAACNAAIARDYLDCPDETPFGPRGPIPEPAGIHFEEVAMIERIYQRHAPPPNQAADEDLASTRQVSRLRREKADLAIRLSHVSKKERDLLTADTMIRDLESERTILRDNLARQVEALHRLQRSRPQRLAGKLRRVRDIFRAGRSSRT